MQSLSAFNIRVPADLKEWLVQKAEDSGRSLNREIVQMIKAAKQAEDHADGKNH